MRENPTYDEFMNHLDDLLYFYNQKDKKIITGIIYDLFISEFNLAVKNALNLMGTNHDFLTTFSDTEYNILIRDAIRTLVGRHYQLSKINKDGYTLKENLIGKVVQLIHDKEMLGVIRGFDNNPRFLIVDFIDETDVKIDIDELYIPSQNKIEKK